jgi:ABC-type nitrate/sulfonate/bicarbonate transport system substrate-binding protein
VHRRKFLTGSMSAAALASPYLSHAAASGVGDFEVSVLRYQGQAALVTFPELAEDLGYLAPVKLNWVGNTISGPQDIQSAVTRDVDFGGAFNGSIIRLIAAGAKIKAVIALGGCDRQSWSGIFVLENSPIRQPRDLIGAKVGINTLGAQAEFDIGIYLQRNGASAQQIAQVEEVVLPPLNLEQALREKQIDAMLLSGVLRDVAMAHGGLRMLVNEFELYGSATMGAYVLRTDFMRDAPNTSRRFVEATAKAIAWVQAQPREVVVDRFAKIVLQRGRHETDKVVRYWDSVGIQHRGGVLDDNAFAPFIDWYAKNGSPAIGRLHPQDMYTNALNPFRDQTLAPG